MGGKQVSSSPGATSWPSAVWQVILNSCTGGRGGAMSALGNLLGAVCKQVYQCFLPQSEAGVLSMCLRYAYDSALLLGHWQPAGAAIRL